MSPADKLTKQSATWSRCEVPAMRRGAGMMVAWWRVGGEPRAEDRHPGAPRPDRYVVSTRCTISLVAALAARVGA